MLDLKDQFALAAMSAILKRPYRNKVKTKTNLCVRHVPVGHLFTLIRTNEVYFMMEIKHETPSGTRYVVRKQGETKNSSLHHSCHVVLF